MPKKRPKAPASKGVKKGEPQPCKHRIMKVQEGTGAWICTACGAEVAKRKFRKSKRDDDYSAEAD